MGRRQFGGCMLCSPDVLGAERKLVFSFLWLTRIAWQPTGGVYPAVRGRQQAHRPGLHPVLHAVQQNLDLPTATAGGKKTGRSRNEEEEEE
jgi:hypothetical protein